MLKRKPSPAMVMSAVALFFSLGGVGYASGTFEASSAWKRNAPVRPKELRITRLSQSFTVQAGHHSAGSVACPARTVVTGGGFGSSQNLVVHGSGPDWSSPQFATNTWNVGVENPSSTSGVVTVYAVCAAVR